MTLLAEITGYKATIGVIGLGYVGLPVAVTAARCGFDVIGFDVDDTKMERLGAGESYIGAVTSTDLSQVKDRFSWTTDFTQLAACQVIVICVPPPLTRQREPDLSYVEATGRKIAKFMTKDTLVILEPTTFPGTTDDILGPILETSGFLVGKEVFLGFSLEREGPGNKDFHTTSIPKIVAGSDAKSGALIAAF
jgi:UDP-N-acetyl-D-glucosamine dehydrogenase